MVKTPGNANTGRSRNPERCNELVDPESRRFYSSAMSKKAPEHQFEVELKALEQRLDDLVGVVDVLKEENRSLKQRQDALTGERAQLLQKNEQVRARVEGMITRLKSMEQG
jgi:cell division protein ZapB